MVIRNLYPTTSTNIELELRLFEVRQVTQLIHRINKTALPIFFVNLEPTDHSNDIFQLDSSLHTKIKVEEPPPPQTKITKNTVIQKLTADTCLVVSAAEVINTRPPVPTLVKIHLSVSSVQGPCQIQELLSV